MWKVPSIALGTAAAALAFSLPSSAEELPGAGSLPVGWTHAEINVTTGGVAHTYVLNRGVVQSQPVGSFTLRESDGTIATVPFGPTTQILVNGLPGSSAAIPPGATVTTFQIDGGAAVRVTARVPPRLARLAARGTGTRSR